jgi:hypothetical protein
MEEEFKTCDWTSYMYSEEVYQQSYSCEETTSSSKQSPVTRGIYPVHLRNNTWRKAHYESKHPPIAFRNTPKDPPALPGYDYPVRVLVVCSLGFGQA